MQQSAAFKILRTRLKTVPSYSFKEERFRRTSSGIPYSQLNFGGGGSQIFEEGDLNENSLDVHNGINFASKLLQFQQIQKQHHLHSRSQTRSRFVSTSSSKDVQIAEESKRSAQAVDLNMPASRSSRRGQLQL
ncbi:hypothetical protein HAX54_014498 [Datura stramonium]|uniref:Uncharacterized protein n=1 Tax=Datura stramonium TaxID=4076 RepID=A0ABS8RZE5_DATST|nr:hypothetical protein [Datura stramonium]